MVVDQTKPQKSTAPPRTLNVQKFAESRATELVALHSIVKNRLNNDFRAQRNKRRRTTGHDNRLSRKRYRKKQKVGEADNDSGGPLAKDEKNAPRRVRRRMELKKNPQTGFSAAGDGTKRLRTHVWHAKRFIINKLWGFYLPIGVQGRGKGSKAILKKAKEGVFVHDASYNRVIQLDGPEDLLLSVLSSVLVPFPSGYCDEALQNILSGVTYGRGMLYRVGSLNSQAIAPVTYMWRSRESNFVHKVGEKDDCAEQQRVDNCALMRQLWIWVHPAGFREGYSVLESECEMLKSAGQSISCISLEGELAKLEFIGSGSFQFIQKILQPITSASMNSCPQPTCSFVSNDDKGPFWDMSSLPDEDKILTSAIISLMVNDPRVPVRKSVVSEPTCPEVEGYKKRETEVNKRDPLSSFFLMSEQRYPSLEFVGLWDSRNRKLPPVEEKFLCSEKYRQSLKLFGIAQQNLGNVDAAREILSPENSKICPLMLLKDNAGDRFTRWSIILPISWVKVFWTTIVSRGAQAIGLRERHWIAREAGLPYFPSDYPDTKAYSLLMELEEAMKDKKAKLKPPSLRPLTVPTRPCWKRLQSTSQIKSDLGRHTEVLTDTDHSRKNVNCGVAVLNCDGYFNGFVARKSFMLSHSFTGFDGNNSFLPTKVAVGKESLPKVIEDVEVVKQSENGVSSDMKFCQKLCFVRVHLRAYREGVFEEGAVVCAPTLSDITLFTTRSDDDGEKCQIPQSLLGSCSDQHPAPEVEFQLPEDPPGSEYVRQAIGFVTTGFVQGSKKATATAICEAARLACLREDQWKTIPKHQGRKEIYVLVRNLRSTAYRLALATIVLETQEDDLEFL